MFFRKFAFAIVLAALPTGGHAQSFTCSFGERAACLDYGDTVCSQFGKCVDDNAVCFEQYQCNFEGFTCKSTLTECADVYDELLAKHNRLVDDYNDLLETSREIADTIEELRDNLEVAEGERDEIQDCVRWATDLDDAMACADL